MPKYGPIRSQSMDWNNPMLRNALLKAEAGGVGKNKQAEVQAIRDRFVANESTRLGGLQNFGNRLELQKDRFEQAKKMADHQYAMGKASLEMSKDQLKSAKSGSDLAMLVGLTGVGLQAFDNRQAREYDKKIQKEKFETTYAMYNSFNPEAARRYALDYWDTYGKGKYSEWKHNDKATDLGQWDKYYKAAGGKATGTFGRGGF